MTVQFDLKLKRLNSKMLRHAKKQQKHARLLAKYERAIARVKTEQELQSKTSPESTRQGQEPDKERVECCNDWATDLNHATMRHKKHKPPLPKPQEVSKVEKSKPPFYPAPYNEPWVYNLARKMGPENFHRMMHHSLFTERGVVDYLGYQKLVVEHVVREHKAAGGYKEPPPSFLGEWKSRGKNYAKETFTVLAMANTDDRWTPGDVEGCLNWFIHLQQFGQSTEAGAAYWLVHQLFPSQFPIHPTEDDKKTREDTRKLWNIACRHATGMKKVIAIFQGRTPAAEKEEEEEAVVLEATEVRTRKPATFMTVTASTKATTNYISKPALEVAKL